MIGRVTSTRSSVRIVLDEERDEAMIFLSDERQSAERGATYGVVVHDTLKGTPDPDSVLVNVAFEDYERLLWIKVNRASKALPQALLADAERI
jgi:hypothetical protein